MPHPLGRMIAITKLARCFIIAKNEEGFLIWDLEKVGDGFNGHET